MNRGKPTDKTRTAATQNWFWSPLAACDLATRDIAAQVLAAGHFLTLTPATVPVSTGMSLSPAGLKAAGARARQRVHGSGV